MDHQKSAGIDFMEQMKAMTASQQKTRTLCYHHLNKLARKGQIVFVGSSLAEQFPVNEMLQNYDKRYHVYNRGVSGDVTDGLLTRMEECVFALEPSKIFINIGTNDMNEPEYDLDRLMANYEKILLQIRGRLPLAKIYMLSYYPVNPDLENVPAAQRSMMFRTRTNQALRIANQAVAALANKHGHTFIDLFDMLLDEKGNLREEYTLEGMHLYPNAYQIILDRLIPYFDE